MAESLALVWDLIANDRASGTFRKVGAEAEGASHSVGKLIGGFSLLAAGGAVAASVTAAAKFQSAMLLIQTQSGDTTDNLGKMSRAMLGLAGQTAQAPEALATSLRHMTDVGLRGKDAIDAVRVAAEGAAVGHADLEATTNSLTSTIASNMVPATETYSQVMGQLNAIVGAGDMSMTNLNEALSNGLLPTMHLYGVSLTQVGAALATFGDVNLRGQVAATDLRMAVQSFFKLTMDGPGILAKYHLSQQQLIDDLRHGGLTQALTDLHDKLVQGGVATNDWGAIITQVFGKKAGVGLAVLLDEFTRYQTKLKQVTAGADEFGSSWEKTTKTAAFQTAALKDNVDALGVRIGTALLPYVTDLEKNINDFLRSQGFSHFLDDAGSAAVTAGQAIGGLVKWFAALPAPIRDVGYALIGLRIADHIGLLDRLGSGAGRVSGAFRSLSSDITVAFAEAKANQQRLVSESAALWTESEAQQAAMKAASTGLWATAATEVETATVSMRRSTGNVAGLGAAAKAAAADGLSALRSGASSLIGMFGGPWGVAIGGAIALLPPFMNFLKGAPTVADKAAGSIKSIADAIDATNGAMDRSVRQSIAVQLRQDGMFEAASKWGVTTKDLVDAVAGVPGAMAKVTAAAGQYDAALGRLGNTYGNVNDAQGQAKKKSDDMLAALIKLGGGVDGAEQKQKDLKAAVDGTSAATGSLTGASKTLQDAVTKSGITTTAVWDKNTVVLQSATLKQIADLHNLGETVLTLPDGKVVVTSDTGPARRTLDALINDYNNKVIRIMSPAGQHISSATGPGGTSTKYYSGGYTGAGGKYEPAGIVHKGEFVVPQEAVDRIGVAALSQMSGLPGYAAGGPVGDFKMFKTLPADLSAQAVAQAKASIVQMASQAMAMANPPGAGVERWRPAVDQVLRLLHQPTSYDNGVLDMIQAESGGNPRAINLTDSNALAGHPSQGLMQTIPSTFAAYAGPYVSRGITDGFANIFAGVNYALQRYGPGILAAGGRHSASGHYVGYEQGTNYVPKDGLAYLHRGEAVVPAKYNGTAGGPVEITGTLRFDADGLVHIVDGRIVEFATAQAHRGTYNP